MAVWSNEAVTEFISLYRSHQCLWKLKCPDYNNRNARRKAYGSLVDFCKRIGFKSANEDLVKKKIQSLRGAFRKELKKVLESIQNGDNEENSYKAGLWYFDQLLFTKDQEANKDDDNDNFDNNDNIDNNGFVENTDDSFEESNSNDNPRWEVKNIATVNLPCAYPDASTSAHPQNASYGSGGATSTCFNQPGNDNETNKSEKSFKRKYPGDSSDGNVNRFGNGIALSDITESDAIGLTVSRKLQRMNEMQALYAETIINTVLRRGILNKLTEETDICENQCNKNFFG